MENQDTGVRVMSRFAAAFDAANAANVVPGKTTGKFADLH
jgi:hypothetical protein